MKHYLKLSIIVVIVALFFALPAAAQDTTPSITVSGMGEASGAPDIAYVELGVDIINENVGTAYSEAGEVIKQVVAALSEIGIVAEDIQTVSLNIWWDEPYPRESGAPMGQRVYHVNNILRITVRDISMIEAVINTAVTNGANNVFGLNFGISDTDSLVQEARAAAVANALSRAQHLAELNGVTLGKPLHISEGTSGGSPLYGKGGGGAFADAAMSSMPIESGQLTVTSYVTITYAIGD